MSLRLLMKPLLLGSLLLGLSACAGEELTYDTWVAENAPASSSDASFKAAVAKTCARGGEKTEGEAIRTDDGDVHHYTYSCVAPAGSSTSSGLFGL